MSTGVAATTILTCASLATVASRLGLRKVAAALAVATLLGLWVAFEHEPDVGEEIIKRKTDEVSEQLAPLVEGMATVTSPSTTLPK
jgi:hypothetical protein